MEENISLSPRLSTITDMIPVSDIIVDVGSDHGKLSEFCLASNRCRFVIATDIHALPAERTRERLLDYKDRCEVKVTDGLSGVDLKEDMTAVIAGMGGLEICKILSNAGESKIPSGMKRTGCSRNWGSGFPASTQRKISAARTRTPMPSGCFLTLRAPCVFLMYLSVR